MDLGNIASVVNLPGMDLGKLVNLILKAASTARKFRRQLIRFATYVRILNDLLKKPQLSDVRKHPDAREVLKQLDIALIRGCRLVIKCKNRSWLYALINGRKIMKKFREVEEDTSKYLAMFPLAIFGCNGIGTNQLQKRLQELLLEDSPKKTEKPRKQKKAMVAVVPADQSEKQPEQNLAKKEKNSKQKETVDEGQQHPQPHGFVKEKKRSKQEKAMVAPVLEGERKEQPEHNLAKEEKPRKQKKAMVAAVPVDQSEKQPEQNLAKKEKNNKKKEAVDEGQQHPQPHEFVKKEKCNKQEKAMVAPVLAGERKEQLEHNLAKEKPRKQKKVMVADVPTDQSEKQPEQNLVKKEKNSKQKEAVDEGQQHPQPRDFVKKKEKRSKQEKAMVAPVLADESKEQPEHNLAKEKKRIKQKKATVAPVPADESEEQPAHHLAKQEEKRSEQKDKGKEQLPSDVAQDMGNNDGKVTAVLKVNMHCVCKGCVERHYNPIVNKATVYTGVECVGMQLDNQIIIVVGRFDAEKLRDHVSKGTKKEVDLVGENYNMPIMVGKVVLKFGTVGLRCNCDGCKDIIRGMICKIKGVKKVCFDKGNNQVIVRGTVDMKELCKVKTEHKG